MLSTCIESSKLSLSYWAKGSDFFVCQQKVAVHRGSPSAATAATRPKTPGQHACLAILLPTSKQALLPIGQWHECRWCQTPEWVWQGAISCDATACRHSLFGNSNYIRGLVKHAPSILHLERAYRLLGGPVGFFMTGTGAENLHSSILQFV